jgi:predicted GNAT family N-acyltransferase
MIESDFRVEPASYQADFKDLRLVRETVFVLEQNVPLDEEWDEMDPNCQHVLARDRHHQPIGTGRLTPEGKIGRMAVLPEWRGKGVGDALLLALLAVARERGWREVRLNAQLTAESFYARHGFAPEGARFWEAGIEHQAMHLALPPLPPITRPAARPRGPTQAPTEFDSLAEAAQATLTLVREARRELWLYSRDLEPALYAQPAVLEAFRQFAIGGRGGVVQMLVQEPITLQASGHPLLALAQRLSTVFQIRTPTDPVDQQYPSAFLANDRDGYLFRLLGSRFEGDWSPAHPARARQLEEHFGRVWERSRPCSELRALGI